jgi:hypothetical protein
MMDSCVQCSDGCASRASESRRCGLMKEEPERLSTSSSIVNNQQAKQGQNKGGQDFFKVHRTVLLA